MWVLNSPTRDGTCVPCIGRQIRNHWTARKTQLLLYEAFAIYIQTGLRVGVPALAIYQVNYR